MPITSFLFLGLVVLVLLAYYVLPRPAQNLLLLVASYVFYFAWSWEFLLVLVSMTLLSYILAQSFENLGSWKKPFLWVGICGVLAAICFFKYANFFLPEVEAILRGLGIELDIVSLKILLPIGLSYYGLQAISYLLDAYHGRAYEPAHFVEYALYLAFFPKLLSGPIESPSHLLPQLSKDRVVENKDLAQGFTLIVLGFLRKRLIADSLFAIIPMRIFETPSGYTAPALLFWLVTQVVAVYNDFAGYTNIARGLSRLFGIQLSRNFRQPFFSRSFTELWTRWHITLSAWLRNTVYLPLSRAFLRRFPDPRYLPSVLVPTMVTMLASALWHGAQINFLIWGLVIGAYMGFERLQSLYKPVQALGELAGWRRVLRMIAVFTLLTLSLTSFFTASPSSTWDYLRGLFDWSGPFVLDPRVLILGMISLGIDWSQFRAQDEFVFLRWPVLVQSSLLALAFLAIFLITRADMSAPFVYQGF